MVGMASDICTRFGERIRELRLAQKWRQLDLAEHAGISENYVSELELGQKEVCLRTQESLAKAFGVELQELFRGLGVSTRRRT